MTYFKDYAEKFYQKLLDNFIVSVNENGLKFNDIDMQKEFFQFLQVSLKESLDKTFGELGDPIKKTKK